MLENILEIKDETKQSAAIVGTDNQTPTGGAAQVQNTGANETIIQTDKEKPEENNFESAEYDRFKNSIMPVLVPAGANLYKTKIELEPATNEEFFALMKKTKNALDNNNASEQLAVFAAIGREKAVSVSGYKIHDAGNWKASVTDADYSQAAARYFEVFAVPRLEEAGDGDLYDINAPLKMNTSFFGNYGENLEKYIEFTPPNKSQFDEYQNALAQRPNKNALASGLQRTFSERMFDVARVMIVGSDYKTEIPAWHLVFAVTALMRMEESKLGKF